MAPALLAMSQGNIEARAAEAGSARSAAKPGDSDKDPALWEVSLKFEAMLMQQMMSSMRKTVPDSGALTSGFAGNMYSSMFDQAIAETGSKSGSLGIAESIYRQMSEAGSTQAKANPVSADIDSGSPTARPKE